MRTTRSRALNDHNVSSTNEESSRAIQQHHFYPPSTLSRETQKELGTFIQPSTYAYYTRVHRSTRQTPFGLVFSRHPQKHTLLESGSAFPTNGYAEKSPKILQSSLDARIHAMQAKANASMAATQRRCKQDYDRQVRVTPTFQSCVWVFIDSPPLATTSDTDVTRTALSSKI